MSGKRSKGDLAAYSSSKFALMGLCQTIRNNGWDKNIRTTVISPSWVNTEMAKNVKSIEKRDMTQPEDISEFCSMILKMPKQSVPFEISVNCNLEIQFILIIEYEIDNIAIVMRNAFILLVNKENIETSSAKQPPKLPVTKSIIIGIELKLKA